MRDEKATASFDRRSVLQRGLALAALSAIHGFVSPGAAQTGTWPGVAKSLTLLVRKPGMSHVEFMRYWLEVHAPMALRVPGMRGFIAMEVIGTSARPDIPGPRPIEIDGIAESWHDATNSPANPDASTEAKRWFADGPKFVGQACNFVTREAVVVKPTRGAKGLVSLLKRKAHTTHAAFIKHWIEVHGPMAHSVPGVTGLILGEVIAQRERADIETLRGFGEVDGIAESWHADTTRPGLTSPEAKRWYADGASSIGESRTYLTQDNVVIEPT